MERPPIPNCSKHIVRDNGPRKKQETKRNDDGSPLSSDPFEEENRFNTIIPSNMVKNDYNDRVAKAAAPFSSSSMASNFAGGSGTSVSAPGEMTAHNYQKVYLEQQARAAAENESKSGAQGFKKIADEQAAATQRSQEEAVRKQSEDDMRFRAGQIEDEMSYWEHQRGQGQYEDSVINGTLDTLKNEIAGIPGWLHRH